MAKNFVCSGTGFCLQPEEHRFARRVSASRLRACCAGFAAVLALALGLPARSAQSPDGEVLKKNKLKIAGSLEVLESESEFKTKLTDARKLQRQLGYSLLQQKMTLSPQDRQKAIEGFRNEVNQMRNMINQVSQQMNALPRFRGRLTSSYAQEEYAELQIYRNQLQAQVTQESAMINQLQQSQKADPKAKDTIDAEVRDRREAYHQALADLRTLADSTTEKYAELAKSDEIKQAIEQIGKGKRDKPKLGPSHDFLNDVKLLEKLEKAESAPEGDFSQPKASRRSRRSSKKGSAVKNSASSGKAAENPDSRF
jgi:hypothetical protein